ncbi:MAG: accessory factor UbiK family protein [Wenzhouxiangellaceae bacterium]|nr:accessory factor UbiK family protein [Wenzhouxiangellaceae bacterium]
MRSDFKTPDLRTLDEITRKLAEALPREWRNAGEDLEKRFRRVLEDQFARLDLVTREEFEIQKRVLERSRDKLEQLERKLDESGS